MQTFLRPGLLTFAFLTVAALGSARASNDRSAALVVVGDSPFLGPVQSAARKWLTHSSWKVTDPGSMGDAGKELVACLDDVGNDCAAAIRTADVERVWLVTAREENVDGGKQLTLAGGVFARDGRLLASDRRYCERCSGDGVVEAVDGLLSSMERSIAAQSGSRTIVRVRTHPSATISIDGQPAGETVGTEPLEISVLPGEHTIAASAPDHRVESTSFTVRDGEVRSIEMTLRPSADRKPGRGPMPWLLTGTGSVMLLGGLALLVVDEDASQDGSAHYAYRDTAVPGIGLTAVGVVGVGVGVYLLTRPTDRRPVAAVTRDGAWIGYAGAF